MAASWRGLAVAALVIAGASARAQVVDTAAFSRALSLEADGKYKEAIPLYRASLEGPEGQNALLGLERAYAELGWTDSLIAPLDSLLKKHPADPIFRSAQLRSFQSLGRDADVRRAFDDWTRAAAGDAAPYREYAR